MNIMNSLTRKHMTSNKKRTIVTILGVIISVAMITAVSTASESFMDFLQRIQMKGGGQWHVRYENITQNQANQILDKRDDTFSFYTNQDGVTRIETSQGTEKPYIYIEKYDSKAYEKMPIKLVDGRLPEKENEIVVSKELRTAADKGFAIGDTLTATTGTRFGYADGEYKELPLSIEYLGEYKKDVEGEQLENCNKEKSYTIVGVVENLRGYYPACYPVIGYYDQQNTTNDAFVSLNLFLNKVDNGIYHKCNKIASDLGIDVEKVVFNDSLLRFYGVSQYSDTFNMMIKMFTLILIVIIMVGSIALIYNSFAISTNERSKQFGMLASVGATKEQKRNAVLYEGAAVGIISIPLGILAGFLGMWITFKIVSPMFMKAMNMDVAIRLIISYKAIIVAVVFSIITIFLSALLPAKKAAKISPIEALRQTKSITIKAKHVRTSRLTRKLFGLEGELAIKNLKRNRKHYKALVFSLIISLTLFISVGSYVHYLNESLSFVYGNDNYDVAIWNIDYDEKDKLANCISQIESVSENQLVSNLSNSYVMTKDETDRIITDECKRELAKIKTIDVNNYVIKGTFNFVNDTVYEQLSGKKVNQADGHEIQAVLINQQVRQVGYSLIEVEPTKLSAGDKIAFEKKQVDDVHDQALTDNNTNKDNSNDTQNFSIVIDKVASNKNRPIGVGIDSIGGGITLIMPYSGLSAICTDNESIKTGYFFKTSDAMNIEDNIDEKLLNVAMKSSYHVYNQTGEKMQNKQITLAFSIFAYGFISLISLICIANLCNTISTSFALRRREFAMLKSVGMTPEAFHKMIMMESVMYGVKACIYGLPISIAMTLWIRKSVSYNFTRSFAFPYKIYAIGIIAVFLVVGIAMLYSSRKVRKENIIDGLKTELN